MVVAGACRAPGSCWAGRAGLVASVAQAQAVAGEAAAGLLVEGGTARCAVMTPETRVSASI